MVSVVVKCGGSLLRRPDVPQRLQRLAAVWQRSGGVVLVAGGGAVADLVRQWQQWWSLSDSQAHWLAIDAMSFQARVLAALLTPPEPPLVSSLDQLVGGLQLVVADARPLVEEIEARCGCVLPRSWEVTSDSIAYLIGWAAKAQRVILVKARADRIALSEAAQKGMIDPYLPRLVKALPGPEVLVQAFDAIPG
jgi:aspartokinase-like uncharacterized kinase